MLFTKQIILRVPAKPKNCWRILQKMVFCIIIYLAVTSLGDSAGFMRVAGTVSPDVDVLYVFRDEKYVQCLV